MGEAVAEVVEPEEGFKVVGSGVADLDRVECGVGGGQGECGLVGGGADGLVEFGDDVVVVDARGESVLIISR